ncbi:MAG: magnesium transporter CorA family protein [Myxococcales bacterium]|jgi:magnesium transporter
MLRSFQISEARILPTEEEETAPVLLYVEPDEEEKRALIERYRVDEHTLNSALDPDEVPRIEFEPEHLAVIFKRPKSYSAKDNFLFSVLSGGMFLFKDRLIVVLSENSPLFDSKQFAKVASPHDIMLKLLNRTIYHFLEHLKVIVQVSDSLEQKINASMENRYLLNLFTLEKSLVYYLNAISSNSTVIDKLRNNAARIGFDQEQLELLEDISIENAQCYKQAEIYSNILSSMMDARASIVNNNLNQLMKTLNVITIGIMVPTFVVSAFSMNVAIPLQKQPFAFWMIMGFATISVAMFMALWRYKKW